MHTVLSSHTVKMPRGPCTTVLAVAIAAILSGCSDTSPPVQPDVSASQPELKVAMPDSQAEQLLAQLQQLNQSGQSTRALALASEHLQRYPDTPELNHALGVLHAQRDDFVSAKPHFEAEIDKNPAHFGSLMGLAMSHDRLGEHEPALTRVRQALALRSEDSTALSLLGQTLAQLGELPEALDVLEQAARQRNNAGDWSTLGQLLRRTGETGQAIEAFEKALELNPRHAVSLLNLGQLLSRHGDRVRGEAMLEQHRELSLLNDRIDHLQRSARLEGATAANHAALANALLQAGDMQGSEQAYRAALAIDPDFPPAAIGLSALLIEQGRISEATQWAVVAVMVAPQDMQSHFVLGMTRLLKGDFDAAEKAFADSRDRGQWGADAYIHVARALLQAGAGERAAQALAQARRINPDHPDISEIETRLEIP